MLRKVSQIVSLSLVLALGLTGVAHAAYNSVTFAADSIISLTGTGIQLTLTSSTQVASYTVNTTSIDFNMEAGSTVTLRSADYRALTNTANIATNCVGGYSELNLSSSSTQTITVTPGSVNICTAGGGGGGGGGGSPAPTPTPTPTSTPGVTPTPTPQTGPTPSVGTHANGTLVLDGSTVYLIKAGARYGFRNPDEYKSHGYTFAQLVPISQQDKSLPSSSNNIVKAMEGTLVLDASDGKTVYMIGSGNTKRGFASATVFKSLGYTFTNLPKINLSDYATGAAIASATAAHPDGALVLEGKTVWWINGNTRQGFESLQVFNTFGFALSRIVPANSADLALPIGPLVKFRDGTLVQDGSDYYIISEGKKRKFANSSALTAQGYALSNVIQASLANYVLGDPI